MVRRPQTPRRARDMRPGLKMFHEWMHAPCDVLLGVKPIELFRWQGVDRAWIVGSCAWRPIVYQLPPLPDGDVDVVLADEGAADEFAGHAMELLRTHVGPSSRLVRGENMWGFPKLTLFNSENEEIKVLDVWELQKHASISEHVMVFPESHQRVAILAGAGPEDVGYVHRMVWDDEMALEANRRRIRARDEAARNYVVFDDNS